ncbi:hypothetical protein ScPMuIL_002980 [Solemya velum]
MTTPAANSTLTIDEEEVEIETVIVILWVSGGFLLITLVSLLACILRSHKKARNLRNQRDNRNIEAGRLRNGGINPAFTSYDEIWTWIPVMRGDRADCTAQIEPTALQRTTVSSTTPGNRPLRPPSYHEATSSNNSQMPNIRPDCSVSTIAQLCANINSPSASRRVTSTQQTEVPRDANNASRRPASNTPSNAQHASSATESNRRHVTRVDVPSLSVHVSPRDRTPRPNVPRPNVTGRNNRNRPCQLQRYTRINDPSSSQTTTQTTSVALSSRHRAPMPTPQNATNASASTTTANNTRYQMEDGMYSYRTGTNGRRVWCDVPPCLIDEDGPPPYTPYPDYPRSERSSVSSQNQNGQAPLMRLDYEYF